MSHFTHTFELLASLWQFPSFPQINEKKSSCFQLFGTEQCVIKRGERGNLYPMFPAVRKICNILEGKITSLIVQRLGGREESERKAALYQISKDAFFFLYRIERAKKLFFDLSEMRSFLLC